jgi:hypothetical protein
MKHKLIEIPIEQLAIEHYLFGLEYPIEKVSEILDVDENLVKEIHDRYIRTYTPERGNK